MTTETRPERLSTTAVADMLGCSTQTVRLLIRAEQLRAVVVGRVLKVDADSVRAYIAANSVGASC